MKRAVLSLKPAFSPYDRISQVPVEEIRATLMDIFACWGKPGAMRVDNGEPLGSPKKDSTPPVALWLIANGVKMIFNKPYTPQMNAKVEKMQDTTARWAEVTKAYSIDQLQEALNREIYIQRTRFPVTRLQNQTRIQVFPALETSRREFSINDFDAQRVYEFLSHKVYTRKVSSSGQITHFGHKIGKLYKYRGTWVQLRFDKETCNWKIYTNNQEVLNAPATNLAPDRIRNLTVFKEPINIER